MVSRLRVSKTYVAVVPTEFSVVLSETGMDAIVGMLVTTSVRIVTAESTKNLRLRAVGVLVEGVPVVSRDVVACAVWWRFTLRRKKRWFSATLSDRFLCLPYIFVLVVE